MKSREPLRSGAFRLLLVGFAAAAFLAVWFAWRTSQRAASAVQQAFARSHAGHELELELERLHSAALAADSAAETFLATWRSRDLDFAAATEAVVRRQFENHAPTLALEPETAALAREIGNTLDERRANFARLVEWVRAGQLSRVREWAEAHQDALHAAQLERSIARLQESERATRERDRAALADALRRSTRAARWSWVAQAGLCALVLWLLWQYERTRRLVIMCAWTRTIQYEGEWLTFEDYLKRRFGLETTHGIRPDQADKILEEDSHAGPPA